jgi:hypothetical protein
MEVAGSLGSWQVSVHCQRVLELLDGAVCLGDVTCSVDEESEERKAVEVAGREYRIWLRRCPDG